MLLSVLKVNVIFHTMMKLTGVSSRLIPDGDLAWLFQTAFHCDWTGPVLA